MRQAGLLSEESGNEAHWLCGLFRRQRHSGVKDEEGKGAREEEEDGIQDTMATGECDHEGEREDAIDNLIPLFLLLRPRTRGGLVSAFMSSPPPLL